VEGAEETGRNHEGGPARQAGAHVAEKSGAEEEFLGEGAITVASTIMNASRPGDFALAKMSMRSCFSAGMPKSWSRNCQTALTAVRTGREMINVAKPEIAGCRVVSAVGVHDVALNDEAEEGDAGQHAELEGAADEDQALGRRTGRRV